MGMSSGKFIAYYRVSTAKQGQSGLGLEAQQDAVARYVASGELMATYQEVETGKGADALSKRLQLCSALDACRKHGATLVIAKLDRLARNVHFVSGLMESKVSFVACDMPAANELTLHIMAAFAEHEAKRISQRTKEALAAVKARGGRLGVAGMKNLRPNIAVRQEAAEAFAGRLRPIFEGMGERGLSQRAMVLELNSIGVPAPKGGRWQLSQVQRVLQRQRQ
jgi:DNA invertase Pin-like site-specific DNA recombinase